MNHPNRSRSNPAANPTPEQVKADRQAAGLTQSQAAALIHVNLRTWQQWEGGERRMHPAFWQLYLIKSKQLTLAQVLGINR